MVDFAIGRIVLSSKRISNKVVPLEPGLDVASTYRLVEKLGQGGFAQVWEADAPDGRRLALKFLPCRKDLSAAKEVRAILAIRELNHPNLIAIDQILSGMGYIIIVMELADGSLLDLLYRYLDATKSAIRPELVCLYLTQAAQGIDFLNAHQHHTQGQLCGFQHRDIKPSNLLLFDDVVKISDYGVSASTGAATRMHHRVGTVQYAAPEVFQGRLSDWSDQYSLAITYVQLRGGQMPFSDPPVAFRQDYVGRRPT